MIKMAVSVFFQVLACITLAVCIPREKRSILKFQGPIQSLKWPTTTVHYDIKYAG